MARSAAPVIDCSDLESFRVFGDYADILRNRTSFNETLLRQCQKPICQALWGFGVPDVSGIGVTTGYVLSIVISTSLCLLIVLRRPSGQIASSSAAKGDINRRASKSVLLSGLSSYFESAIYFSLAIQIATITILAPKDLETAPSSIGYYEIRIAGLVSTLSLLPLPAPMAILLFHERDDGNNDDNVLQTSSEFRAVGTGTTNVAKRKKNPNMNQPNQQEDRHPYRLAILCFTVLASVYTTLSQSIRYWSPTSLGDHKGDAGATYITSKEWGVLWDVCFGDLGHISFTTAGHITLGAFHMLASITILLFTVALLFSIRLQRVPRVGLRSRSESEGGSEHSHMGIRGLGNVVGLFMAGIAKRAFRVFRGSIWGRTVLVLTFSSLAVPLLWGFFKLRAIQTRLALVVGGGYEGNDWGFGQVMAIAVFAPVGAEMLFVWARARLEGCDENPGQERQQDSRAEARGPDTNYSADPQVEDSALEIRGREGIKTWPW